MKPSEHDMRIIEAATEDAPKIHQPRCPRCAYEPLEFACNVIRTVAGHLVAIIWCGHCGYTLNAQFVGAEPPQVQAPMIVRPS